MTDNGFNDVNNSFNNILERKMKRKMDIKTMLIISALAGLIFGESGIFIVIPLIGFVLMDNDDECEKREICQRRRK
jgi:hypothetical protein